MSTKETIATFVIVVVATFLCVVVWANTGSNV
jgi:hypothetical protein